MRGMPYQRATSSPSQDKTSNTYVSEALAKQAALRPAKSPPKVLQVTPALPKVAKNRRRRRTV